MLQMNWSVKSNLDAQRFDRLLHVTDQACNQSVGCGTAPASNLASLHVSYVKVTHDNGNCHAFTAAIWSSDSECFLRVQACAHLALVTWYRDHLVLYVRLRRFDPDGCRPAILNAKEAQMPQPIPHLSSVSFSPSHVTRVPLGSRCEPTPSDQERNRALKISLALTHTSWSSASVAEASSLSGTSSLKISASGRRGIAQQQVY